MTYFFMFNFVLLVFWRPQEWLFPILYGYNILDLFFYMALLCFLVELKEKRLHFSRTSPFVFLPVGLYFATLMSHIANTYFLGLINMFLVTYKFCFFTVMLYCVLDRSSRLLLMGRVVVVMAVTMVIHAWLQQTRGYGYTYHPPVVDDKGIRSLFYGIFEDPNDLAQMLVMAVPFAFVFFKRSRFLNFIFGSLITWFLVCGVIWTRSRGGVLALIALGAFMLMMRLPSRWIPYVAVIGGVSILALGPIAAGLLDDSAHDRIAFWGTANWVFKSKPLFGVGYGMLPEYIPGARSAHSAFVLCYSEIGVFGYWFWFSMLQLGAVGCWRAQAALKRVRTTEGRWLRSFVGMSMASLVGFSAAGYFLTRAFVYPAFFIFALCGAATYVTQRHLPADHPPLISVKRDLYLMCTIGSLVSIVYIYFSIIMINKAWMMA